MKKCKKCNDEKPLTRFEKNRAVCHDCRREMRAIHEKNCNYCGKKFKSPKNKTKFCSSTCSGLSRERKDTVKCSYCGEDKQVVPSVRKRLNIYYCNQNCRTKHMKITLKGKSNPNFSSLEYECDGCNKVILIHPYLLKNSKFNFCGFECYKENIGRLHTGENNHNWNHDLTEEERIIGRKYTEYYEWRNAVYSRDGYTCRCCGDNKGKNLNAHHIENYSSKKHLRTELSNGITLCNMCHINFHKTYGCKNNDANQLNEYITKTKDALA